MEQKDIKKMQNNKGITLVALVVTIIVLTILASISIGAVFSEKGIIQQAKDSKKQHEDALAAEERNLNDLLSDYNNSMGGSGSIGGGSSGGDVTTPTPVPTPSVPTGPNGNQLVTSVNEFEHETIIAEDSKGNKIVVPGGFKFAEDCGRTVQDGIVVEDSLGNQFVWIPVSNINHDGTGKITKNNGDQVEITLGRYTFDTSTGIETKAQYGSEYETPVTVESYYQERAIDVKDLEGFVNSVRDNHGFFFGRYEASRGTGSRFGLGVDDTYYKPKSVGGSVVWKNITKGNAQTTSRQMYYNNSYVESDLVNSYMWDTAIVYIQAMGHTNYANQKIITDNNSVSGCTGDVMCNIYDMASDLAEWTTEYSTTYIDNEAVYYQCVYRGVAYGNTGHGGSDRTAARYDEKTTHTAYGIGFRVGLWLK